MADSETMTLHYLKDLNNHIIVTPILSHPCWQASIYMLPERTIHV